MKSIEINLTNSDDDRHECESTREGDWIIFTCPHCPGYERRMNLRTRDMTVNDPTDGSYSHSGRYFSHDYDHAFTYQN